MPAGHRQPHPPVRLVLRRGDDAGEPPAHRGVPRLPAPPAGAPRRRRLRAAGPGGVGRLRHVEQRHRALDLVAAVDGAGGHGLGRGLLRPAGARPRRGPRGPARAPPPRRLPRAALAAGARGRRRRGGGGVGGGPARSPSPTPTPAPPTRPTSPLASSSACSCRSPCTASAPTSCGAPSRSCRPPSSAPTTPSGPRRCARSPPWARRSCSSTWPVASSRGRPWPTGRATCCSRSRSPSHWSSPPCRGRPTTCGPVPTPAVVGPLPPGPPGGGRVILDVDPQSAVPPYEQLRAQVTGLVTTGGLPPGTRLPSIRQLAGDLGLAPGTVARAYRELEAAGVVATRAPPRHAGRRPAHRRAPSHRTWPISTRPPPSSPPPPAGPGQASTKPSRPSAAAFGQLAPNPGSPT